MPASRLRVNRAAPERTSARRVSKAAPQRTSVAPEAVPAALADPRAAGVASVARFADLQRAAGNRSASRMVAAGAALPASVIRRAPPTLDSRVSELERQQKVAAKRQQAANIDALWRSKYSTLISDQRQAVYRISGSFQKALTNFQATQTAQMQMDAVWNQIIALAVTTAFAFVFEPVAGRIGAALNKSGNTIPRWRSVEGLENPANSLVAGGGNVATAAAGNSDARDRGAPAVDGGGVRGADPLTYLTENLEVLEKKGQVIETAFADNLISGEKRSLEDWEAWDATEDTRRLSAAYAEVEKAGGKVANLYSADTIARIIEKHLWAAWMRQHVAVVKGYGDHATRTTPETRTADDYDSVAMSLGSEVEDKLNALGIASEAGVVLTGHWYSSNSDNYREKLFNWANHYNEKIAMSS